MIDHNVVGQTSKDLFSKMKYRASYNIISLYNKIKKITGSDIVFLDEPIDGIAHIKNQPVNTNGVLVPYSTIKPITLINIYRKIINGGSYSLINRQGRLYKVRVKKEFIMDGN